MKRRPGATSATNLSRDELRVLSRIDLRHEVRVTRQGVSGEYHVSLTPEAIHFLTDSGGGSFTVHIADVVEPLLDHSNGTLRLDGTGVEIACDDHATKSAIRRVVLTMSEMLTEGHQEISFASLPSLQSTKRHEKSFETSSAKPRTNGTRGLTPPPPPAALGLDATTSTAATHPAPVPAVPSYAAARDRGYQLRETSLPSRSPSPAKHTTSTPFVLLQQDAPQAPPASENLFPYQGISRQPPQLPSRGTSPIAATGGGPGGLRGPDHGVRSDEADRIKLPSYSRSPVDQYQPPPQRTVSPLPRSVSPQTVKTSPVHQPTYEPPRAPTPLEQAEPTGLSYPKVGLTTPAPPVEKCIRPYPPCALTTATSSTLEPPSQHPFSELGPSMLPIRMVDLVQEPANERGKLMMLLSEDDAGNRLVAFYNGHPEVELYIEMWITPDLRPAAGVTKSLHAQYKHDVFCVSVQPGETKEFVVGRMKQDPQPGWRTQPLSEASYTKRRKERERAVYDDYQRLQKAVDPDDPEQKVLEMAIDSGVSFVDLWFLPQPSSIAKPHDGQGPPEIDAWGRPAVYLPPGQRPRLLGTPTAPNDIDMGIMGNAWFQCCLSAVAEYPTQHLKHDIVGTIFARQKQEYTENGAYRIVMARDGWWRDVIVDDYVPLLRFPKKSLLDAPAFCRNIADKREMWASMVEKAYAKLCGSYTAICTGYYHEGLMDLTGMPAESIKWSETKDSTLFNDLLNWDEQDMLVLLQTPNADGDEDKEKMYEANGLTLGHAYVLLQVMMVDGHRLVRVRNPWPSTGKWQGRWADGSPSWDKCRAVKAATGHSGGGDGTIWIAWPEVLDWFVNGSVCHLLPQASEVRLAMPFRPGSPGFVVELKVKTPMKAYIGVHLKDQRNKPAPQPYGCMNVTVLQCGDAEMSRWEREREDYEWGTKDYLGVYEFVPEGGTYLVCVHDYDGGAEGGRIHDDVVITLHYQPLKPDGPSVEGTLSLKTAAPVLEAIQFNPVKVNGTFQAAEAYAQVRRNISAQAQPIQHQLISTMHL